MRQSYLPRLLFVLLAALGLVAISMGVTQAHPKIVAIEPTPDARLDVPPERVRISFSEPVEPLSSIQLFDARGQQVDEGGGAPRADDPTILELTLPPLEPGIYTVVWTIIGSDSHILKDNFAFTVLDAAAALPGSTVASVVPTQSGVAPSSVVASVSEDPQPAIRPVAVALRGAMLIGATGVVGGLSFLLGVLLPTLAAAELVLAPAVRLRWRLLTAALLGLLLITTLAMFIVHTLEATNRLDINSLQQVSTSTRFGQALLARFGLALGLLVAVLAFGASERHRHRSALMMGALSAGLLLTFAASGHASVELAPVLPVLSDWLHLAATSLWVGGLLCFALLAPIVVRSAPDTQRAPLLSQLFARFSALALGSVAVLTVTGTYAALRELTSIADLWQTAYGQALLLKLLLFTGLLVFGAYHLLVARPRLASWASQAAKTILAARVPRWIGATLRVETGLALLALLAAAALTSLPPPEATGQGSLQSLAPTPTAMIVPTVTPAPTRTSVPSQPFDQTQSVADLQIRLAVTPASIGENRFQIAVTDQTGAPVATQLVRLTFEMVEMDMGTNELVAEAQEQTLFVTTGSPLSMVGDWQVRVLVRRADADDVEASFVVPVGE